MKSDRGRFLELLQDLSITNPLLFCVKNFARTQKNMRRNFIMKHTISYAGSIYAP